MKKLWIYIEEKEVEVKGYSFGSFFVHRGQGTEINCSVDTWVVTHIPTGLSVYQGLKSKETAEELAIALDSVPGTEKGKWGNQDCIGERPIELMRACLHKFKRKHKLQ